MSNSRHPRLELTWPGKDQFLLTPSDASGKPVWVDPSHPAASEVRIADFNGEYGEVDDTDPYADNLLFTGDSIDVLRILAEVPEYRRQYRGRIRLAYIDPPFNTGQAFEHYDDWMEHSTWLSFMRDRLLLLKDLLASDGSVWVHLDDAEAHRMRCLMDEIFGADNFIASVVWKRRNDPRNSAQFISMDHDQILVYARNHNGLRFHQLARTEQMDSAYSNPDNDPRGPWRRTDLSARNFYSLGQYPIRREGGIQMNGPPAGRYWSISEDKFWSMDADGRIYWGRDGTSRPYIKRFLSEVTAGRVPGSVWHPEEVGFVRNGKEECTALLGSAFSTPKPERLLERVLAIATDPGDIVVDVFGGSGTTAAVAHKMGRRWVTAELSPTTVESFTRPRLEKVVAGTDPGGITDETEWPGGGGFRTVSVAPSLYALTDFGVLLTDAAEGETFARAMAAQLGFTYEPDASPFCGRRGRMRLAVYDGPVGPEEVRDVVAHLDPNERVTVVAKVVLPEAAETLAVLSRGSRVRKAPRDVLSPSRRRRQRRT